MDTSPMEPGLAWLLLRVWEGDIGISRKTLKETVKVWFH